MPRWRGHPDPVFGLSAGVDEDSRCRRYVCGMPGVVYPDPAFGLSAGVEAPGAAQPQDADLAYVSTFRMNTCKSVSKQKTLTPFRINTCEKPRGRGASPLRYPSSSQVRICITESAQALALSSRSPKYCFQPSGSAPTRSARRNDFTSPSSYLFAIYSRVISETGTAFSSRELTLISSPPPTSPSRETAR